MSDVALEPVFKSSYKGDTGRSQLIEAKPLTGTNAAAIPPEDGHAKRPRVRGPPDSLRLPALGALRLLVQTAGECLT